MSLASIPRVVVIGPGGCGKDTVARLLAEYTGWPNLGSISLRLRGLVARALGLTEEQAWETRRERRVEWREIIDRYQAGDPARVVREVFSSGPQGGILTGLRPRVELAAARPDVDFVLWVERPGLPTDPTLELRATDADHVISNQAGLADLEREVASLAATLRRQWARTGPKARSNSGRRPTATAPH